MHRDVKPENIIYHNQKVVLLDFGFACLIPEGDPMSMTECVGSPVYMSPELLLRRKYNSKSDIWSLGVLLYEMVYGIVPFYSTSESKLLESILTKSVRYNPYIEVKDSLKELISKCLVVDVNARINWKELFRWSKKNNRKIREWFEEDTDSVCYCRWF